MLYSITDNIKSLLLLLLLLVVQMGDSCKDVACLLLKQYVKKSSEKTSPMEKESVRMLESIVELLTNSGMQSK